MPSGPIAILAGAGQLPIQLVDHLERTGQEVRVLAFRGFAEAELRRRAHATVDLLDLKTIMSTLEGWRPQAVSLVGAVRRPGFSALLSAYSLLRNMHEVKEVITRGDDQVLRGAVMLLEERGHRVVGAHELAPDLVASRSLSGTHSPNADDREAVTVGLDLLKSLSAFDIGQGAVIARRHVLAIEGPEGTDRMIRRVMKMRQSWFGLRRREEGGVLIKAAKRGQDLRVDMPTIGPRTVTEAARAGLSGIAVGAGSTFVLEQEKTLRTADRLGLFLVAVDLPWMEDALG
ncbi:LpxI family protein [Microvirga mediterraneensis]|uniref:UDP-2,3-diacylglucosamine diphosphatase LpxI n=1 Tax=Microvirga mediterraneensis TaxID=2754695 RepID=A0A838BPM2_9HYPH|nr:UDP-2,3-diacylglucosamine diphosphatase LpxI [Microvirga mediterraneensis]MBA1157311.1 UDP-2,3-diacylglucosamine diphosphatase LpxI [Microvirga mediterraneensis]